MPWREVSKVEQRREFVRFALQEGANRRELCRRFGIHPETGYKWLQRWRDGDQSLEDHSRRPLLSPGRCSAAIEARVLAVRDAHPAWGARKIARCLAREGIEPPAGSTVHAILVRHARIVPPPGGAPASLRFEKEAPNRLWQMDFKGWIRLGDGTCCHPLTVVDDHSRYVPCLVASSDQKGPTVQAFLTTVFHRYGLPDAVFVDNGNPWGDPSGERWTRFGVWLLKLGVDVVHSRPYHPQSRGKNERFHRTLADEVFALRRFHDSAACNAPSTPGARSTTSSDRTRRSARKCRRAATGRARGRCPTGCRSRTTTRARRFAPCPPAKPTSASRAGRGKCRRRFVANASPSARSTAMATTASSSPPTKSPTSVWPTQKSPAMSPNTCRISPRAEQQAPR
jgi:transposase InsO family protein